MPKIEQVTVTLPGQVERELSRRRRVELRKSLQNPHPESTALAEVGFQEWSTGFPAEDATDILDLGAG